jgi:hypothetical protein
MLPPVDLLGFTPNGRTRLLPHPLSPLSQRNVISQRNLRVIASILLLLLPVQQLFAIRLPRLLLVVLLLGTERLNEMLISPPGRTIFRTTWFYCLITLIVLVPRLMYQSLLLT